MKRILLTTILILMLSLLVAGSASAKNDKINIKGEVTEVGAGTITVLSNKGITYEIVVSEGFDLSSIQIGDSILVKGQIGEDGSVMAESIKLVGNGNDKDDGDENQVDGGKRNSAYCPDGKQEKPHPFATKMAERYGVTEGWVMEYFCDGYGMGQIMLALKTGEIEGIGTDPESLLTERANGIGWGVIWKDLGLIGSEKEGHSPPGLLKKPDHVGPKNKD
ncbi:MAG: hypothetical protein WBL25_18400 [Anaerolineales bacterium]